MMSSPSKQQERSTRLCDFVDPRSISADALLLDYFLHQSIVYRLHFLAKPCHLAPQECSTGLQLANTYTVIADRLLKVTRMHEALFAEMAGPRQQHSLLREGVVRRKAFAKLIGMAFFPVDPECPSFSLERAHLGPCCVAHQMLSWKELLSVLMDIEIPNEDVFPMLKHVLDIQTAVVVHGAESQWEWEQLVEALFPRQEEPVDALQTQAEPVETIASVYEQLVRERRQQLLAEQSSAKFAAFVSSLRRAYDLETIERNLLNWTATAYAQSSIPAPDVLLAMKDPLLPASALPNPPTERDADGHFRPEACAAQQRGAAGRADSARTSAAPSPQKAAPRGARQEHPSGKSPAGRDKPHAHLDGHGHAPAERIQWSSDGEEDDSNQVSSAKAGKRIRVLPAATPRPVNSAGARHRRPFSDVEVTNLMAGIKRFGRNWSRIMEVYAFDGRTNVDLKDKARNLARKGLLEGSYV